MSSEIKANKWSPATGTAATLGDSSDTFTVPSGVTLDIASGATIANSGSATGFGGGKVLQLVYDEYTAQQSTTSDAFVDLPNLSVTITLTNSSNKVLILGSLNGLFKSSSGAGQGISFQLLRDATKVAGFGNYNAYYSQTTNLTSNLPIAFQDNPADTSAHTYKFQWERRYDDGTATVYMNSNDGNGCVSTIMALEIET